ncbi:MAG: HAMP domain-containing sensor histidine kinase [Acidimicrobiales bacterium]
MRTRTALTFGLGAALVSAALAVITYALANHELLNQRQTSSLRQAFVDARLFKDELASPASNIEDVLTSLAGADNVEVLVYRHRLWFSTSALAGRSTLTPSLVSAVRAGHPADQRIFVDGAPELAVGIPIPSVGAFYFEIHSLGELRSTLETLAIVLAAAAAATTLGGAVLGLWASRRLVRPLADTAQVASEIAGGRLDQRLPPDSDLGPLVDSFNDMVARLQERIERDARFAADLSHEMRSPLTTVGASVELVDSYRRTLPEDGRTALDLLKMEIDRFSGMVQDLLEISRVDADADPVELERIAVDELVEHIASSHPSAVPVRVLPAARGASVLGDKRRLQRILVNLLDNAEAHGGGASLVWVDRRDDSVEIAVEDHGPGVDPTEADRVFERFYRGKVSGRRGSATGSGLGLALVAEHVRAHRGSVRVEPASGGGARFIVSLPFDPP